MTGKIHKYVLNLAWTGNLGSGTATYSGYSRAHKITAPGKAEIAGSSDPAFRGDPSRWNPEEMLVASLAACHQLWYLHLCTVSGITVLAYEDHPVGEMEETPDGNGQFKSVTLQPKVTVTAGSDLRAAELLHGEAHKKCFVARSVNFPVGHKPTIVEG